MLTDTHTKYKVSSDLSTCMPLFADVPDKSSVELSEEDNQQEEYPGTEFNNTLSY
jgi:hypothetical protein